MIDHSKVNALIDRAVAADKADDAMKFSQAALNSANALRVVADVPSTKST